MSRNLGAQDNSVFMNEIMGSGNVGSFFFISSANLFPLIRHALLVRSVRGVQVALIFDGNNAGCVLQVRKSPNCPST